MSAIKKTLRERGGTHGKFTDNAAVSQAIKHTLRASVNWEALTDYQKESLEMIAHKMSRIVSGNANYMDGWRDIAGYAKLVEEELAITPGSLDSEVAYRTV